MKKSLKEQIKLIILIMSILSLGIGATYWLFDYELSTFWKLAPTFLSGLIVFILMMSSTTKIAQLKYDEEIKKSGFINKGKNK